MGSRLAERVVMLHSSGSSPRQWKDAAERLRFRHSVATPRLVGHEGLESWTADNPPSLAGEVDALCRQIEGFGGPVHLVGHSAGAAVAIKAALARRIRVASLTLYEPTPFSVLRHAGISYRREACPFTMGRAIQFAVAHDHHEEAAQLYTDYWSARGTWAAMSPERRLRVTQRMGVVSQCFTVLFDDSLEMRDLVRIDAPCLVMMGERSPHPAQDLAEIIAGGIAGARLHRFADLGHLGPIHAPAAVNAVIEEFLDEVTRAERQRALLRLSA
jgi:pimeloyl-ACP methyl ester carboxylesterase